MRWDTRITYANSSGICPLYCNYYTENLTLMNLARYARPWLRRSDEHAALKAAVAEFGIRTGSL